MSHAGISNARPMARTGYGKAAETHFSHPRNRGSFRDPDGEGQASTSHCQGLARVQLRVDPDRRVITEARFQASGCLALTAALSLATEVVREKTVKEALQVDWCQILELLGGVPAETEGCVRVAVMTLREAAHDHLDRLWDAETSPALPRLMIPPIPDPA